MRPGILLAALLSLPVAAGAECAARTGPGTTALLELYTSEGCNSCPPADRWFSALERSGFGAASVVPLAFHVDYWDYIGWKDRFASPAYTERQREGARLAGERLVYTPQVKLSGRDFRGWGNAALRERLAAASARPAAAEIALRADAEGPRLRVAIEAALRSGSPSRYALFLAVTESGLSTEVKAGENRGERLHHDHVVRVLRELGGFPASGRLALEVPLALDPGWKRGALSLAAFVQDRASGEVVQAVALASCGDRG